MEGHVDHNHTHNEGGNQAESELVASIYRILCREDVSAVKKTHASAMLLVNFLEENNDEIQLAVTQQLLDQFIGPAYEIIKNESGEKTSIINSSEFQNDMEVAINKSLSPAKVFLKALQDNQEMGKKFFGNDEANYKAYKSFCKHVHGPDCASGGCKVQKVEQVIKQELEK